MAKAGLLAIVGLRYLWDYSPLEPFVAWAYAVMAYAGHLSALAYIPFLVLLPVIMLIPQPHIVLPVGVVLASADLSFLLLDSLVFAENRYHLNVLTFTMLEPQTWAFLALYFVVGLVIEAALARWVWTRTALPPTRHVSRYLALVLAGCFLAGQFINALAQPHYYVPAHTLA